MGQVEETGGGTKKVESQQPDFRFTRRIFNCNNTKTCETCTEVLCQEKAKGLPLTGYIGLI